MPSATASPCSSRELNPVSASRAWPKVWPKFNSARSPSSRSSPATISAFIAQLVITARRSATGRQVAHCAALGFQPVEELGIADQPVFGDLGVAGEQLAPRQRRQGTGIRENQTRLVEGADQVLAVAGVDPGLAADRAVDLGQQCRRDLHEIDAAQQRRRGEAGDVADDAAAERHQHRTALDADRQDFLDQPAEMVEILGLLARRQQHGMMGDPGFGEAIVQAPRDNARRRSRRRRSPPGGGASAARSRAPARLDQPRPDEDVVGAIAQLDAQPLDRLRSFAHPPFAAALSRAGKQASAAIARVTVASGDPSPLSTTISASA